MSNTVFDQNIETLRYLGYVTHNAENEITETARRVAWQLNADNVRLSDFGNQCGTHAAKYWNEAKRERDASNYATGFNETETDSRNAGWTFDEPDVFDGDF